MPEGPSIVILKEEVAQFAGEKIIGTSGNSKKIDISRLEGETIGEFKGWGKHFLICFSDFTIKIHFLLFGSYRINETKDAKPRLSLQFEEGELNFYACSVILLEGNLNKLYDWTADVMSPEFSSRKALKKLREKPNEMVSDVLLDQNIFAGVGNIIKNEVLFRIRVHPESQIGALSDAKLRELVKEAVAYSFDFMRWKKEFTLKKNWLAHTKKTCPRDGSPISKSYPGKTKRRAFYCEKCQRLLKN